MRDDGLNTARGIVNAFALSAPFWIMLIVGLAIFV